MTDLSRNLLDAARGGMTPDAAAMARVRAKVAASVAASAGTAAIIPAAKAAKVSSAIGAKLAVAVLALGVVVTAVVMMRGEADVAPARVTVAPTEIDEPRGVVQGASMESAPDSVTPSVTAADEPRGTRATPAREPASLAREVELIDQAMVLVRRGAPAAALGVLATFSRETRGHGQMAEDGAAIDIEARCRLHQDVTARLATFDRTWPSSAQRSRLHNACFAR